MQVKKFEAQTMKEVLEIVKADLGPDAIILSVRDNTRSFGLLGESSVEVTAAVSEKVLHKKKFAESKINQKELEDFRRSSAKNQKKFIEKSYDRYVEENERKIYQKRQLRNRKYADIKDVPGNQSINSNSLNTSQKSNRRPEVYNRSNIQATGVLKPSMQVSPGGLSTVMAPVTTANINQSKAAKLHSSQREITELKSQISQLQGMIQQFKKVPQTFVNSHPGSEFGLPYSLSSSYLKLKKSGVDKELVAKILFQAQESLSPIQLSKESLVDAWAARYILGHTSVVDQLAKDKIHIFVGSNGQGKTSCLVKMASHLIIKEKKTVAILSGDTEKVGAVDQLKIYSQILNVPFGELRGEIDWPQILKQLTMVDYVLVDMPGLKLKELSEVSKLKKMMPDQETPCRIHYVQSATAKDEDAFEMARRYRVTNFHDVIFNHIDESLQHGLIYNFQRKFQVPLHSFGVGSHIPEDYEIATKERVLDLIFKISN